MSMLEITKKSNFEPHDEVRESWIVETDEKFTLIVPVFVIFYRNAGYLIEERLCNGIE